MLNGVRLFTKVHSICIHNTRCGSLCTIHCLLLLYTQDPLYPEIFYECIFHCWKQDYLERPSAEEVSKRLKAIEQSQSSVMNKHTIKMFNSIPTIAAVSTNGVQCLWAVTKCQHNTELMVIQQNYPSGLNFVVRTSDNVLHACPLVLVY